MKTDIEKWYEEDQRLLNDKTRFKDFKIEVKKEFVQFGPHATDYVGFFAPVEETYWAGDYVFVKNKYGIYYICPETQEVTTEIGIKWETLTHAQQILDAIEREKLIFKVPYDATAEDEGIESDEKSKEEQK